MKVMFENRALKLEIAENPGSKEESRVCASIYADDEHSPLMQIFGIRRSRINIVQTEELHSPYGRAWSLEQLMSIQKEGHLLTTKITGVLEEMAIEICKLCKRLNPQHETENCTSCRDMSLAEFLYP